MLHMRHMRSFPSYRDRRRGSGLGLSDILYNRPIQRIVLCSLIAVLALWSYLDYQSPKQQKLRHLKLINGGPGLSKIEKALVVPKTRSSNDDVTWVLDLAPEYSSLFCSLHKPSKPHPQYADHQPFSWTPFVYTTSYWPESGFLAPPSTRGHEAVTYLHFIISHYDNLPHYTAFVHASPDQWHNDVLGPYTSEILRNLRVDNVDRLGYINFRCTHMTGCPTSVYPLDPTREDIAKKDIRAYFAGVYKDLFNTQDVPKSIGHPCCAQFAVSRDRILQRPKSDYERMMKWAIETKLTDNFGVGWVFEKIWHIVFGMDAVHCPSFEQCRCDLFGWCGPLPDGRLVAA